MNNKISISTMMEAAQKLKKDGAKFSLLGIGPMSRTLIESVIELAKEKDFPIMLIASRNQVDCDNYGGGYVCSFDQERFVNEVERVIADVGFDGLCYLCRDHGGPWQRDEERKAKLDVDKAMDIAKYSYIQDMKCGFDLLHIDPTKDPHVNGVVPLDLVLDRTVELIEYIEKKRVELNLPSMAYEVGTEETNGGLTSIEAFDDFAQKLTAMLSAKKLPKPLLIVGQTGTLTRLTENVGRYNTEEATRLTLSANKYGIGLKEHNGDYLSNEILLEHPIITLDAMNVAPEFGVVETAAYIDLCKIEEKFIDSGRSRLMEIMTELAVNGERWRKWIVGDLQNASVDDIMKNKDAVDLILRMCGHYTLDNEQIKTEMSVLTKNLKTLQLDVKGYAKKKIKESIDRYVYSFNMYGLTSKIIENE